VRFGILGSLAVWQDGGEVAIGAAKQRALLALLLIRRGELVPTETLVDELWGERPPPTAVKALRTHVWQLRKTLEQGMLETHPSGYRLRLDPDALDSARFEGLLARARDLLVGGAPQEACELLREALALWRGPALAEFRYEAFARDEIARLEELRLVALEQRLEAELALGHHATAVPELEALVTEHPLRETLVALLMLALYRSGRQAEALDVYRDARAALVDQLGLEPRGTLKALERAILTHDPALDLDLPPPPTQPQRRRRRVLLGLTVVAVAAVAIAVGVVLTRGGTFEPLSRVAPNSIAIVDPDRNALVDEIRFDTRPAAVAVANGALWVAMQDDETLLRIDPHTHRISRTIGLGATPIAVAAGGANVWVICGQSRETRILVQVDAGSATVIRKVALNPYVMPNGFAADADAAWVANLRYTATRVDAATGSAQQIGSDPSIALAVGEGAVWTVSPLVNGRGGGAISRIDPRTRTITSRWPPPSLGLANYAKGLAATRDGVWVISESASSIWKLDTAQYRVTTVLRIHSPTALAVGEDAIWTANDDSTVSRIDPHTANVTETIPLGRNPRVAYPVAIAAGDDAVWVAVH